MFKAKCPKRLKKHGISYLYVENNYYKVTRSYEEKGQTYFECSVKSSSVTRKL